MSNTIALGLLALLVPSLIESTSLAADTSYLRPGDRILWVGDSITAQNIYEPQVMSVLHTLYPDAKLTDVNAGIGGATAPTRFDGIPALIAAEHPTLMTVMFGVNDTGWSAGDADAKITRYTDGLQKYVDAAHKAGIPLLFIHETNFSHNQKAAPLEEGLDALLLSLFASEDRLAAEKLVPVIDGYGAYSRELRRAWAVDPRYEFTPNFVHPTHLGHAALAGEILKALGAGLPLATGEQRGRLHLPQEQPVELTASLLESRVYRQHQTVPVEIQVANKGGEKLSGSVRAVVNHSVVTLPATVDGGSTLKLKISVPVDGLQERWTVEPLFMCFISDKAYAAGESPFFASHLRPATAQTPYTHNEQGWLEWEGRGPHATSLNDLTVVVSDNNLRAEFTWKDATPVHARSEPYRTRAGEPVDGPLDLTSPFGQPCDAVELLLDLRGAESTARYTANMDSLPEGTARAGLYQIEAHGKSQSRLQIAPPALSDRFHLTELGNDRYAIEYTSLLPEAGVGFDAIVSDATTYKPNQHIAAWLTSVPNLGHDWVDFLRLTSGPQGVFVRVGY